MYMKLALEDGREEVTRVGGPGGILRFAVGEPTRRSRIWCAFANRTRSDVYISARGGYGKALKISLHETGDWRDQWLTPEIAYQQTGRDIRALDRWPRPPADSIGWTQAFSIWIPGDEMTDIPSGEAVSKVKWIPNAGPDHVHGLHILVAKPDLGVGKLTNAVPIGAFALANGEIVILIASRAAMTSEARDTVEKLRTAALAAIPNAAELAQRIPTLRIFGRGATQDGHRFLWDLAARRPG